jgi:HEPN domain-containing protein
MTGEDGWRPWWDEAQHQLAVARKLLDQGQYSNAIFGALMAFELAAKAARQAPALVHQLDVDISDLKDTTIGQLGGDPPKRGPHGHLPSEQLDEPWHPQVAVQLASELIAQVERQLKTERRLKDDADLYKACRYPDQWQTGSQAPYRELRNVHAEPVFAAVADFLDECRRHLEG